MNNLGLNKFQLKLYLFKSYLKKYVQIQIIVMFLSPYTRHKVVKKLITRKSNISKIFFEED